LLLLTSALQHVLQTYVLINPAGDEDIQNEILREGLFQDSAFMRMKINSFLLQ